MELPRRNIFLAARMRQCVWQACGVTPFARANARRSGIGSIRATLLSSARLTPCAKYASMCACVVFAAAHETVPPHSSAGRTVRLIKPASHMQRSNSDSRFSRLARSGNALCSARIELASRTCRVTAELVTKSLARVAYSVIAARLPAASADR